MSLFDVGVADASLGWQNIRAAKNLAEFHMKTNLERLWTYHEPAADEAFRTEFARQPDTRFWEMYLGAHLVRGRKRLLLRKDISDCLDGDKGPDFGIRKGNRVIWIEAIAPSKGDQTNVDRVPGLLPKGTSERILRAAPRRQIELRITSALYTKALKFRRYRENGIIGENDSCIVAISGAQFSLLAGTLGLPYVVSAVYPFGDEQFTIDRHTLKVISRQFTFSESISRSAKPDDPIGRMAFHSDLYQDISGIIWSSSSIGNFSPTRHDLVYVHNQHAERPIPRAWLRWRKEYYPPVGANTLHRRRRG